MEFEPMKKEIAERLAMLNEKVKEGKRISRNYKYRVILKPVKA